MKADLHLRFPVNYRIIYKFHLMIGKCYPNIFSFILRVQTEQSDTETAEAELSSGRVVNSPPPQK